MADQPKSTLDCRTGITYTLLLSSSSLSSPKSLDSGEMGGCFSCRSSSSFRNVRVVHMNGYVQDFDHPIAVCNVTGKLTEHFLCTPAQLVSVASNPALNPDVLLQPGKIYFMLPYSTLHPDVSPMDLASIARKLSAAAKSRRKMGSPDAGISFFGQPARIPCREGTAGMKLAGAQRSPCSRSWRPLLDTINERPLNQRSESDLQEKHVWD